MWKTVKTEYLHEYTDSQSFYRWLVSDSGGTASNRFWQFIGTYKKKLCFSKLHLSPTKLHHESNPIRGSINHYTWHLCTNIYFLRKVHYLLKNCHIQNYTAYTKLALHFFFMSFSQTFKVAQKSANKIIFVPPQHSCHKSLCNVIIIEETVSKQCSQRTPVCSSKF